MGRHAGSAHAFAEDIPFVSTQQPSAVDLAHINWEQRVRGDEERTFIAEIRKNGGGENNSNYLRYADFLETQGTEADTAKAELIRDMCALGSARTLSSDERARAKHYDSLRAAEEIGRRLAPFSYGRDTNVRLRNGLIDEITISGSGEGAGLVASVAKAHPIRKLHVLECSKSIASMLTDAKVMEGVEELTLRGVDPDVASLGHLAPKLHTLTCHPLDAAPVCGYKGTHFVRELNVIGCLPDRHEERRRWKLIGEYVRIDAVSASYRFGPYSFLNRFVQPGITTSLDINANIDENGIETLKELAPSLERLTIRGYSLSSEDFADIFSTRFPKLRELTLSHSNADSLCVEALISSGTSHNLEVVSFEGTHIQESGMELLDSGRNFPKLLSITVR